MPKRIPATASPPTIPMKILNVKLTSACSYSRLRFSTLGTRRLQNEGPPRSIAAGRARIPTGRVGGLAAGAASLTAEAGEPRLGQFPGGLGHHQAQSADHNDDSDADDHRENRRVTHQGGSCSSPPSSAGQEIESVFQQHALAEQVGGKPAARLLQPIHEAGPNPGRDEFPVGATVGIDAELPESENLLHDDRVALHAHHLGNAGNLARPTLEPAGLDDQVDGRGELRAQGADRQTRGRPC